MFSAKTEKLIAKAINEEYKNAVENYGEKYNSLHEGYAVLKEEVEETEKEFKDMYALLSWFWQVSVKSKIECPQKNIKKIKKRAISLILEACQVAAVCEKIEREEITETPQDESPAESEELDEVDINL